MVKSLVLCCDGTWNRPSETKQGVASPTNVAKVALAVADQDAHGAPQLLHYEAGVGTRRHERILGGVFGYGLSHNVLSCYRFLVENYVPGDKLFFFGFSRGAFTARSTVGLVRNCGILKPQHLDRIEDAYDFYRDPHRDTEPNSIAAEIFRREYSQPEARIHFVGVWDTVGALGIPIGGLRLPILTKRWSFHDPKLSSKVDFAYHALAIDEHRRPFKPTLWKRDAVVPGQTLEQVWFAGVHSDVGGGYLEPALAEIPLVWMVERASRCELAFKPDHFVTSANPEAAQRHRGLQIAPNALGEIHKSWKGFYRLLPPYRRPLKADAAKVAPSAIRRFDEKPGYHPRNLKKYLAGGGA